MAIPNGCLEFAAAGTIEHDAVVAPVCRFGRVADRSRLTMLRHLLLGETGDAVELSTTRPSDRVRR